MTTLVLLSEWLTERPPLPPRPPPKEPLKPPVKPPSAPMLPAPACVPLPRASVMATLLLFWLPAASSTTMEPTA